MGSTNESMERRSGSLARLRPWAPILLACVMLSSYSSRSGSTAPIIALSWRDKVDHFCVYALLATLVFQALPSKLQGTARWLSAFLLVSAFGIWDETIQHFNPARTGDPLDWLADSMGALTAVIICSASPLAQRLATWNPFDFLTGRKKACRDRSTTD